MSTMNYQIVSDGSCDLPRELTDRLGITVVPFYVSFDDVNYQKEMVDIEVREFYRQMVEKKGVYPKSSMPSIQDYADVFKPIIKAGEAVICICITTKFSGSMQSALNAKAMLLEEYKDAEITIIDATINTVLQGIYVLEAAALKERGASYEESVKRLEEIKSTGRIFFTVGDMSYLKHGGRIGKLTGIAGSVLGIKPLITLKQGEIFPSGITRSRKKSMDKVIELLLDYLHENKADMKDYSLAVGFGYDKSEAEDFKKEVLEVLKKENFPLEDIPMYQIGATIGVHTGPYPIGLGIIHRA